jgi:hypothetical protein
MTNLFGNLIYRNILAGTQFSSLAPYVPTNRKAFFSFHKPDDFRVNAVRKTFQFRDRSDPNFITFYDSSLWEKRKLTNPEAIKTIIRYGVSHTSVVCVLAGSFTWSRPWVRYEIARSVIDGKGLLTVHINSINHHQLRVPHIRGPNPLAYMGSGRCQIAPSAYMSGVPDHTGNLIQITRVVSSCRNTSLSLPLGG